jgi:RND superfamily putative drug exporter
MQRKTTSSLSEPWLPRLVVRAGGWAVLVWLVIAGIAAYFARDLEDVLEVGAHLRGSEAVAVRHAIATHLPAGDAEYAILVARGLDPRNDTVGAQQLDSLVTAIGAVTGVARVHAYRGPRDSLLVGTDGSLVLAALDPEAETGDRIIPKLREATSPLADAWVEMGVTLRWTGESALNTDLRRASARDSNAAEARAVPLTLVILVLAFGSVIAAGLPLVVGLLTIVCALGAAGIVGRFVPLSLMLQSLVTMIGLGLGIDYALLIVRRFREEMGCGRDPRNAAVEAARHGGRTILISGAAVLLGFAGLSIVPLGELRSAGFGGAVTALLAVAISTTLLPPVLARIGARIDRFRVPQLGVTRVESWRRWGVWVCKRPVLALVAAGVPLLWLAWEGTRLRIGTPEQNWLPPSMESAVGIDDLHAMRRAGLLNLVQVLVTLPESTDALSPGGWDILAGIRRHLVSDERIRSVLSFSRFDTAHPTSRLRFLAIPHSVRDAYVSKNRRVVLLKAIPTEEVAPQAVVEYVNELRPELAKRFEGRASVLVGGLPGFRADFQNRMAGWLAIVILLVTSGTFVALAVSFRSILIPVKALALNLLSVAGGFGIVKLVFHDGWALSVLGLPEPISAVFPIVPILAFCTVFGLSMDYEVFLVARVAEFRRLGFSERDAIAEGLARSAPLITSASAIMVVVFGAFALGEFLLIQVLGLALAAAVFLDATLVRIAVGPALLAVAGRWNWWPGVRGTSHG